MHTTHTNKLHLSGQKLGEFYDFIHGFSFLSFREYVGQKNGRAWDLLEICYQQLLSNNFIIDGMWFDFLSCVFVSVKYTNDLSIAHHNHQNDIIIRNSMI